MDDVGIEKTPQRWGSRSANGPFCKRVTAAQRDTDNPYGLGMYNDTLQTPANSNCRMDVDTASTAGHSHRRSSRIKESYRDGSPMYNEGQKRFGTGKVRN